MKLLIFTQKIDRNDSVLGFFHGWVVEFSKKVEELHVICLEAGNYDLPNNVTVHSLGKEKSVSKISYLINLFGYLYNLSGKYDKVFVHMNQEYVILAGLYWKLKSIPVYMWRNHLKGNLLTYISVLLSSKIFCTSSNSYTARFEKTIVVPAGVDTEMFKPVQNAVRKKYSVCMVGRIAPVKNIEIALEAMKEIISKSGEVTLSIIGSYLEKDKNYFYDLKKYTEENGLSSHVTFLEGVPPSKLPEIYSSFEVCLNLTDSGSFDKTIVESASCGAIPVVSNMSLRDMLPEKCITDPNSKSIADSIQRMLLPHERIAVQKDLEKFVESQSLGNMLNKVFKEIE